MTTDLDLIGPVQRSIDWLCALSPLLCILKGYL